MLDRLMCAVEECEEHGAGACVVPSAVIIMC